MATELHTFDPDGDLLLILSRPANDDSESMSEQSADGTTHTPAGSEVQRTSEDMAMEMDAQEASDAEEAAGTGADLVGDPALEYDAECEGRDPDITVHMLVSSKHMMLASPVFKAMLQSSAFQEGRKLASAGNVQVPLPDDDPTAFIIILDVIHGRNKRVPRKISLGMLTKISVIVDKYQMAEGVESYSAGWIEALMEDIPTTYDKEDAELVHRWLGICWVFEKGEEFKELTQLIERGCWGNLVKDLEGLPIPDLIASSILERRQGALFELYDWVEQTVRRYQQSDTLCPREDDDDLKLQCDYLVLGSLTKSATNFGIMPIPAPPYGDISFDLLADRLYSLDIQAICDSIDRPKINKKYPKPAHGLKKIIRETIESLEERLSGLDIQEFKKNRQSTRPIVGA